MKRTALLLTVLAVIIGTVVIMSNKKANDRPITEYEGDFAVDNVKDINRIVITKGREYSIDLRRTSNGWRLNDKYIARAGSVGNVLNAIKNIDIKYIPPKKAEEFIMWDIAANGIQVDVYDNSQTLLKSYFLAGSNFDESGTHALMNGSDQPFVVHMPSMDGSLRARFQLNEDEWRDRHFMDFESGDIQSVTVDFPRQKSQSFILKRNGDEYSVTPLHPEMRAQTDNYRKGTGDLFLKSIAELACESYKNEYPFLDSIRTLVPFSDVVIAFDDQKREDIRVKIYPNGKPVYSEFTGPLHRLFFDVDPGDFVGVQYHVVKNVLKGYDYFFDGPEQELVF